MKYYCYAYAMNDSMNKKRTVETIKRMQSQYNYNRYQEIATKEKEKASEEKNKRNVLAALLFIGAIIVAFGYYNMLKEKKIEQERYETIIEELAASQSEIMKLREHADVHGLDEIISEKEKRIEFLQSELDRIQEVFHKNTGNINKSITTSAIYQVLLNRQYGPKLTMDEINECRKLTVQLLPELNNILVSKQYQLNRKDYNVCMLFRFGFKSKEICNMLDLSKGRVSQICTKVLLNVFNDSDGGAANLIEKLSGFH